MLKTGQLVEEHMPKDGNCFFSAVATALNTNEKHYGYQYIAQKFCANLSEPCVIKPCLLRKIVAESILTLSDDAPEFDQWKNCVIVPEFVLNEYKFAEPLLKLKDSDKVVPMSIREEIRDRIQNRHMYWADFFGINKIVEVLRINIAIIEVLPPSNQKITYMTVDKKMDDDNQESFILLTNIYEHFNIIFHVNANLQKNYFFNKKMINKVSEGIFAKYDCANHKCHKMHNVK